MSTIWSRFPPRAPAGNGRAPLWWLAERARAEGCELHLDSGVERLDAHRLYEREGMDPSSLHFRLRLSR